MRNNDQRRGFGTTAAATRPRTEHRISQPSRTFSSSSPSHAWAKGRSLDKEELLAPTTDDEVVDFFRDTLPPLHFPKEVALRMITHATWKYGTQGHNHRLSFIGRRVLHGYLTLFLHSQDASGLPVFDTDTSEQITLPQHNYDEMCSTIINTYTLGEHVGREWRLERVMRWTPARRTGTSPLLSSGLHKIRGVTVEAIVGGVFHQFGGSAAHRLFHTQILPILASAPIVPLSKEMRAAINDMCKQFGGRGAPILPLLDGKRSTTPNQLLQSEQTPEPDVVTASQQQQRRLYGR